MGAPGKSFTYQLKELKEVHTGIQGIFHPLQTALGQGTHGSLDSLGPSSLAEDDEPV